MELLVGLLVEVLISFVVAVVPAIASFAAAVIAWIVDLISDLAGSSGGHSNAPSEADRQDEQDEPVSPPANYSPSVALKWIKRASVGVFVVIIAGLIVINFLFLKPIGNWALAKLEQRTGIEVAASDISGNLFTGSFRLTGLTAKRESSEKSSFDLKVDEVSGNLVMNSLVFGTPVFDTLSVNGVSGRFDVKKRDKDRKPRKIKTRRDFIVKHMMISGVTLQLYNASKEALDVNFNSVESRPLRSNYAVFDVFFRSNISGTLAGRKLEIRSAPTDGGRATTWKIDQLPVSVLGHFSDAPVISWLEQGTLDIDVTDSWKVTDRAKINMDWRLLANNVKMQIPADAGLMQKTVFIPAQKYLNGRDKPVDVSFSLVMNEDQFEGAASLEAANLWATVRDGFIKALALKYRKAGEPVEQDGQTSGSQEEKARGLVDKATDSFKSLLDKTRKAPVPEN
ncbi:hypothetical protein [Anderseniella sp. Alg231-50]|uniref:hypothetical protein n=1 Tax=Anderseniella sp. Alg231-50 TaxID=1922226 RepID=UPI000D54E621